MLSCEGPAGVTVRSLEKIQDHCARDDAELVVLNVAKLKTINMVRNEFQYNVNSQSELVEHSKELKAALSEFKIAKRDITVAAGALSKEQDRRKAKRASQAAAEEKKIVAAAKAEAKAMAKDREAKLKASTKKSPTEMYCAFSECITFNETKTASTIDEVGCTLSRYDQPTLLNLKDEALTRKGSQLSDMLGSLRKNLLKPKQDGTTSMPPGGRSLKAAGDIEILQLLEQLTPKEHVSVAREAIEENEKFKLISLQLTRVFSPKAAHLWRMEPNKKFAGVDFLEFPTVRLTQSGFRTIILVPLEAAIECAHSVRVACAGSVWSHEELRDMLERLTIDQWKVLAAKPTVSSCTSGPNSAMFIPAGFMTVERTALEPAAGIRKVFLPPPTQAFLWASAIGHWRGRDPNKAKSPLVPSILELITTPENQLRDAVESWKPS